MVKLFGVLLVAMCLGCGTGDGTAAGGACDKTDECVSGLRCINYVCTDLDAVQEDAEAGTDAVVSPWEGKSYYTMKITTELGQTYELERDITERPNAFSFGSTHIAPAVSFAISEDLTFPATMNLTLNFGIVFGSDNFPIQCDSAKSYPFSAAPPEVDVTIGLLPTPRPTDRHHPPRHAHKMRPMFRGWATRNKHPFRVWIATFRGWPPPIASTTDPTAPRILQT